MLSLRGNFKLDVRHLTAECHTSTAAGYASTLPTPPHNKLQIYSNLQISIIDVTERCCAFILCTTAMNSKTRLERPGSSVKNPTKRTPDQKYLVPSRYLNSTTSSSSKGAKTPTLHNHRHNLTTTFNANITGINKLKCNSPKIHAAVAVAPTTDWELECDFAYNEYLQALMKKQIFQAKFQQIKTSINDQLSIYSESLFNDKRKYTEAQQDIEQKQLLTKRDEVMNRLNETLDEFLQISTECNLEMHLDDIISVLDLVKNRIFLENVEALKNQEECDKLASLLIKCNDILSRIKESTSNYQQLEKLANCLSQYLNLQQKVVVKNADLVEQQKTVGYNTLKGLSDYFAKNPCD